MFLYWKRTRLMARVRLPGNRGHGLWKIFQPFQIRIMAEVHVNRTAQYYLKKITIIERYMQLYFMKIDILEMGCKMAPLIIVHNKKMKGTGGIITAVPI